MRSDDFRSPHAQNHDTYSFIRDLQPSPESCRGLIPVPRGACFSLFHAFRLDLNDRVLAGRIRDVLRQRLLREVASRRFRLVLRMNIAP